MAASIQTPDTSAKVVGIVLAAGAGRRMGGPKALIGPLATPDRTPLARVCEWVHESGCPQVIAVIGAEADAVRRALACDPWPGDSAQEYALNKPSGPHHDRLAPRVRDFAQGSSLPPWLEVAEASDWAEGMGASLRTGLRAAAETGAEAALVTLVDLPDVQTAVYARVLAAADGPQTLARASFAGIPGHPVLIGRAHWDAVAASAVGDQGARSLFVRTPPALIECGDLASGQDADQLPR